MCAGIAKSIKQKFPAAYAAEHATECGSLDKLGRYSSAVVDCGGHQLTVVNAYTQFDFNGDGVLADYEAIGHVFALIKADFGGRRIGYPMIGAGLAGGDWEIVAQIIKEELKGEDHTLVMYQP